MPPELIDTLLKIVSGVMIAVITAWLTVRLSREKFRSERWWEKKVAAYERVIDAFHNAKKFASEHMNAEYNGTAVSNQRDEELRKPAREARDEIVRASDVGSFILSENALKILARYEAESGTRPKYNSWYEYIDADWSMTHLYLNEFIQEAKADLGK